MAWVFKLVCGSRELSLIDNWKIREGGAGFTPSKTVVSYGDSSPWQEGAQRTSSFHENQEVSLSLNLLQVSGQSTLSRIVRDLQQFFDEAKRNQEQGVNNAVYLVRRTNEGFTGTVLFGRGDLYYEVMNGELNLPQSTFSTFIRGDKPSILEAELRLTCAPFAVGKPTFCAEATGYVRFDSDGNLSIYSSASNNCLNPSFENTADFDAGWTVQDSDISASIEYERVHGGFQAARIVNTGTSAGYYRTTTAAWAASGDRWYSGYVYTDGASATGSDLSIYFAGASRTTTYEVDSDHTGWTRISGSVTAATSGTWTLGTWLASGKTAIIDDFTVYKSPSALIPYFDGDSGPGCVWQGSSASSSASQSGGQWRIRTKWDSQPGYENLFYGKGAISVWVKTPWAGNDGVTHIILDTGVTSTQNSIRLVKGSDNNLIYNMRGSTTNGLRQLSYGVNATTWAANTWYHIVVTWDATGPLELWLSGTRVDNTVASSGTWTNLTNLGTYVYVGSDTTGALQWNGQIADLRIFGPDASVNVADLYASGRGKSELGSLWTTSIGGALQNTSDSTRNNNFWLAGVPGDTQIPLRLFFHNLSGQSIDKLWWGLRRQDALPYYLNIFEAEAGYTTDNFTTVAAAARSSGSYARISPGGTTEVLGTEVIIVSDQRKATYFQGRYKIIAEVYEGAVAGTFKVRGEGRQGVLTSGTPPVPISDVNDQVGDQQTLTAASTWLPVDLGTFDIPINTITPIFHQQRGLSIASTGSPYFDLAFWVEMTSGAGSSLDVDRFIFLPADMSGVFDASATVPDRDIMIVDAIESKSYVSRQTSTCDISMEKRVSFNMAGEFPFVPPYTWVFGNTYWVSGSSLPADTLSVYSIYQPRFLWGR